MTRQELLDYWLPACHVVFNNPAGPAGVSVRDCIKLDNVLGVTEYRDYKYDNPANSDLKGSPLPENIKSLLIAFAGPHGKTIFKAYKIRKSHGVEP